MVTSSRGGLGRPFANLFTANLASSLGDGIARTAIPLLAARLTSDPFLVSVVAALALLPWLFFAIPAGILIDRIDRRRALAMAQAVRTALAVLLIGLVATDSLTIWWLYIVVFVYGMFETVYDGAIRAVVPSIVDRANLPRANSRIEGGELVVQNFVSGPVTSALFAVSVLVPLGINGLVFAVAGALALALPRVASGRQFVAHGETQVAWYRQFSDGLRFISCVRWREASISNKSAPETRFPAMARSRWMNSGASRTRPRSIRSSTAVDTLFTFWPPGPLARTKRQSRSRSSRSSSGITRGMAGGTVARLAPAGKRV